ncbi:hypothetical protein ACJIZ3_003508 [Penstemon smallii]|uniref:Uncharacterized protein n=1 Tax=Penstemon smallii TaxID=265156 RepID=A0ABD3UAY7_9LAMI
MASNNNNPSPSSNTAAFRFLRLLEQPNASNPTDLDLDETDVVWSFFPSSDVYSSTSPSPPSLHHHHHHRRFNNFQSGRISKNIPRKFHQSAPVNIPVWPKNFRGECNYSDDEAVAEKEDEVEEEGEIVPPHVIVAKSHVTFSVFEGVGRTLKGRDLYRVRDAVFQQTDAYKSTMGTLWIRKKILAPRVSGPLLQNVGLSFS